MKLTKTLILLLLITMNFYVSAIRKTSVAVTETHVRTKGDIVDFLVKIKEFFSTETFKNVRKVIEFILGVASVWFSVIEDIWNLKEAFENLIKFTTECNPFYKAAKSQFLEEDKSLDSKNEMNYLNLIKDPVAFCIEKKTYFEDMQAKQDNNYKIAGKWIMNNYCDQVQADILDPKEKTQYKAMCNTFKNKDCKKLILKAPEETNFVITVYETVKKYYKSISGQISTFKECASKFETLINNKVFEPIRVALKPILEKIKAAIAKFLSDTILSPFLQYLSVGVYGQLKVAYQFYKFVIEVKDLIKKDLGFAADEKIDNAFKIGKLVGRIIKMITSAVSGVRK